MARIQIGCWLILAVVAPGRLIMATSTSTTPAVKVNSTFLEGLRESKGKVDIIVLFAAGTKQALEEVNGKQYASREERLNAVNKALTDNAAKSQAAVQEFLRKKDPAPTWESKWINNSIFIKDADAALIDELVNFAEVGEVREDKIVAKILLEADQPQQ